MKLVLIVLAGIFALEFGRILAAVDPNTKPIVPMLLVLGLVGFAFMLGRLSRG